MSKEFDVALSFAGEDRHYARELENLLNKGGYSVFYDKNEQAMLWGKNLYDYLSSVYKDKARYCIMFLSKHYAQKWWTNHERQSAQARAFEENQEYILPVRIDDTEIPGILKTIGFLDLRSMTIEQIYQVLVEKLSGTTSPTAADKSTITSVQNYPGEIVLLLSENGMMNFIPVQNAHWGTTEINLDLLPESSEDSAFLQSLRNSIMSQFSQARKLAFAHKDGAAWVKLKDVTQTTSGSKTVWKVKLEEDSRWQDSNFLHEIKVNNIGPNQIAELRARRILLDEKFFQNPKSLMGFANDPFLESIISCESSIHWSNIQIKKSPIPQIYRSFGETVEKFLKFARLTAVLYLKLSNTVEDILELDLELLAPNQLKVNFKGRRYQIYTNTEPVIIEVSGIWALS